MSNPEPSPKSPTMEQFLEDLSSRTSSILTARCVEPPFGCGQAIGEFRDELSEREYRISGLCQSCQDSVFGTGDD